MIKRKFCASLATVAALGSVVALGPINLASADTVNPVTRMAERTNPAVQLVEADYRATVRFHYSAYTSEGQALENKAFKLWDEGFFSGTSDFIEYIFGRVKKDPNRYLEPMSGTESFAASATYTGSSFVASPDGYIVTAKHMASVDGDVRNSFTTDGARRAATADMATWMQYFKGFNLSESAKHTLKAAITAYQEQNVSVHVSPPKVQIVQSTATSDGSQQAKLLPADVVYLSGSATGEDIAVLHVQGQSQMPALPLATTAAQQGDTIFLDGFPGLVDTSEAALLTPTVTQGQVTAIKPNSAGLQQLQTNATASPGASGAAALNENGEVIGMEFAGAVSSQGSLGENYLMPLNSIRDALARAGANARPGQTTTLYNRGLDDFHHKHYRKALGEFNQVKALYAAHAYVDSFISKSQLAISRGENVPVVKPSPKQTVPWSLIVPAALSAFGLVVGAALYFVVRRAKKKVRTESAPKGPDDVSNVSSPISPVVAPYASGDPLADLLAGTAVDEVAATSVASPAESNGSTEASDDSEVSEDGPDAIPDSEWEPLDYIAGFPDSETRPNS